MSICGLNPEVAAVLDLNVKVTLETYLQYKVTSSWKPYAARTKIKAYRD